jgi:hypothetical protein
MTDRESSRRASRQALPVPEVPALARESSVRVAGQRVGVDARRADVVLVVAVEARGAGVDASGLVKVLGRATKSDSFLVTRNGSNCQREENRGAPAKDGRARASCCVGIEQSARLANLRCRIRPGRRVAGCSFDAHAVDVEVQALVGGSEAARGRLARTFAASCAGIASETLLFLCEIQGAVRQQNALDVQPAISSPASA